ncbi:MAG: zinc ribbon domain-containing protein [Firmicutes bacterium]|nr:zinc ribbon domain-containing protein [Bacillota bacterium]
MSKFCAKCGAEIIQGAKRCSSCGAKTETKMPKIILLIVLLFGSFCCFGTVFNGLFVSDDFSTPYVIYDYLGSEPHMEGGYYTLAKKQKNFLNEKPELFPVKAKNEDIIDSLFDEIDFNCTWENIEKNPSSYGDKLMMIRTAIVGQKDVIDLDSKSKYTLLGLIDPEKRTYIVYYIGELNDIDKGDEVVTIGLPLAMGHYEIDDGGQASCLFIAGSVVEETFAPSYW